MLVAATASEAPEGIFPGASLGLTCLDLCTIVHETEADVM